MVFCKLRKLATAGLLGASLFTLCPSATTSATIEPQEPRTIRATTSPDSVRLAIRDIARAVGTDEEEMLAIVRCETAGTFNPEIQSEVIYNFSDPRRGIVAGERERSFGLAQIHLPDHPSVTYEMAINPDFALYFLARHLALGNSWMWSCAK